jgi:hypothetical protein
MGKKNIDMFEGVINRSDVVNDSNEKIGSFFV